MIRKLLSRNVMKIMRNISSTLIIQSKGNEKSKLMIRGIKAIENIGNIVETSLMYENKNEGVLISAVKVKCKNEKDILPHLYRINAADQNNLNVNLIPKVDDKNTQFPKYVNDFVKLCFEKSKIDGFNQVILSNNGKNIHNLQNSLKMFNINFNIGPKFNLIKNEDKIIENINQKIYDINNEKISFAIFNEPKGLESEKIYEFMQFLAHSIYQRRELLPNCCIGIETNIGELAYILLTEFEFNLIKINQNPNTETLDAIGRTGKLVIIPKKFYNEDLIKQAYENRIYKWNLLIENENSDKIPENFPICILNKNHADNSNFILKINKEISLI